MAISRLKADYCDACDDDHNGDAVARLFLPDGVWEYHGQPPHVGTEAIAAHMFSIRAQGHIQRSAHLITNPVITVDGDQARGSWRFQMIYTGSADQVTHHIIGRYDDRFERSPQGWRFRSLLATVEQR